MNRYTVSVSSIFEADNPEDAVMQMAAWLDEYAYFAGYRVDNNDKNLSFFIDAEILMREKQ